MDSAGCDVLFATAELVPIIKTGGLAEASTGLVRALRSHGLNVEVVVPDYGDIPLPSRPSWPVPVPEWVGQARARRLDLGSLGDVIAVSVPGIHRPHPYIDPATGHGWHDNDRRFISFSAAVAELARQLKPSVVHLNDWHTGAAAAWIDGPVLFTLHNASFQGWCDRGWLTLLGPDYEHEGGCSLLVGALRRSERVVAVSEAYAEELARDDLGMGLAGVVRTRQGSMTGIRNGIDVDRWNPLTDTYVPAPFSLSDLTGKRVCTKELRRVTGLDPKGGPVVAMVTRLTHQKGVDLALHLAPFLPQMPAAMMIVGDGDPGLVDLARHTADAHPGRVWVADRYSDDLAHLAIAGADLYLAPSRFEPCGLGQMEAMAYGTLPVVTATGGLRNTVIDADEHPEAGFGWVASSAEPMAVLDAMHRAVRGWSDPKRRRRLQIRGMSEDWSWARPARAYRSIYASMLCGQ